MLFLYMYLYGNRAGKLFVVLVMNIVQDISVVEDLVQLDIELHVLIVSEVNQLDFDWSIARLRQKVTRNWLSIFS